VVIADPQEYEEKLQNAKYALAMGRKIGARIYATPEHVVNVESKMVHDLFCHEPRGVCGPTITTSHHYNNCDVVSNASAQNNSTSLLLLTRHPQSACASLALPHLRHVVDLVDSMA